MFLAQFYGIDLSFGQQLTIVLTATLASLGTAGIPGAGVIMLAMVLRSVGVPLQGIGIIMGVDRFLDMCRTVVNMTGDSVCTMVDCLHGGPAQRRACTGSSRCRGRDCETPAT